MTFQARYLQRWSKAIQGIEDFAVSEWVRCLSGLTPEDVRHGLDNLPDDWPPTVGEFRNLCEGRQDWTETATGIRAKAKDIGIEQAEDEPFPVFRDRVFRAAGTKEAE